jgi:hypothetical protein
MSGVNKEKSVNETLKVLSKGAKRVLVNVFLSGSQDMKSLKELDDDENNPFDLEVVIKELSDLGLIQKTSLIDEKIEMLDKMSKEDVFIYPPLGKINTIRDEEKYSSSKGDIERFEEDPDQYKPWQETRYRLNPDFQEHMEAVFGNSL